jgi:hypothetical protein
MQESPHQACPEILAQIANDVDVGDVVATHFVNDAVHSADNLAILGKIQIGVLIPGMRPFDNLAVTRLPGFPVEFLTG